MRCTIEMFRCFKVAAMGELLLEVSACRGVGVGVGGGAVL